MNLPTHTVACQECAQAFQAKRAHASFCCAACRTSFNNRRHVRGAEIYDLFMMMRYERGVAQLKGVWKLMCRIAEEWRYEDATQRDGRPSWSSYDRLAADGRFARYAYTARMQTRAGR